LCDPTHTGFTRLTTPLLSTVIYCTGLLIKSSAFSPIVISREQYICMSCACSGVSSCFAPRFILLQTGRPLPMHCHWLPAC